MDDAEAYTKKEYLKDLLVCALSDYMEAAYEYDMDDSDIITELKDIISDAGLEIY